MKLNQSVESEKIISEVPEDFGMLGVKKVTESGMPMGKTTPAPLGKNQIMPLGLSDLPGRPGGKMEPPQRSQRSQGSHKSVLMVSQIQNSRLRLPSDNSGLTPEPSLQIFTGIRPTETMGDSKIPARPIQSRIMSQFQNRELAQGQDVDTSQQPVTPRGKERLVTQLYENALNGQSQKGVMNQEQSNMKRNSFFGIRSLFKSNATTVRDFSIRDQDQFIGKSHNCTLTADIGVGQFKDDHGQQFDTKILKFLQNDDNGNILVAYCGELELETLLTGEKIPIFVVENPYEGNEKDQENVFRNKLGDDHSLQILENGDLIFNGNGKLVFQRIAKGDGIQVIDLGEKLSVKD